jgi:hypothetical protein
MLMMTVCVQLHFNIRKETDVKLDKITGISMNQ